MGIEVQSVLKEVCLHEIEINYCMTAMITVLILQARQPAEIAKANKM